jgi:hypothetical protein
LNQKAAQAFAQPYAQLLSLLPQQVHLNADETGHKENGRRYWTWCFRAKAFIVFEIQASRGSDVLFDLLGQNFQGSLGADFWGAYRKYAGQCGVLIQFCLAHLIREVKYLCEFPDPSVQRYGQALLARLKELFDALHRRAELSSKAFALALATAEAKVWVPHWTRSRSRAAIPTAKFTGSLITSPIALPSTGRITFISSPTRKSSPPITPPNTPSVSW